MDMDEVFLSLRKALEEYCLWCSRGKSERLDALEKWADAVYEHCRRNWAAKLQSPGFVPENPSGYPHLRRVIQEAHKTLVFLLDDRAPHGFFVVCKRWYQREMAKYLDDNSVFEASDLTWPQVVELAKKFNDEWDFATGTGIVYNYGIWKPTKGRFRFIAGTRSGPRPRDAPSKPAGPPRQPLYEAHKVLVRILQHIEDALREKDQIRQSEEGIKAFWGIDSVNAFTRMVRANADVVLKNGMETVDFCTMYTSFPFRSMIDRTLMAVDEAWDFVTQAGRAAGMAIDGASREMTLGPKGWSKLGRGYTKAQVAELLTFLIEHNYVNIGGRVLRQIKGMPMGMPAAPQIANLACYPVEKAQAYALGPGSSFVVSRYIDDIASAGVPLPSQEDYGMEYKTTAKGSSVVYLGVRVYEKVREDGTKVLHTTVHDREESYPHHIVRYPDHATVAPREQLGGVIMGRLVHCQETCSHMEDFKESVATVFRNAVWRGYPKQMVEKVWRRFLFQRWHAVDIRVKELRCWFPKVWAYLLRTDGKSPPEPTKPAPSLQAAGRTRFLQVFGAPRSALSRPTPSASAPGVQPGSSSSSPQPDAAAPPVPSAQLQLAAPSAQPQQPQPRRPEAPPEMQVVSSSPRAGQNASRMEMDPLLGKRVREEEQIPETAPMTIDNSGASVIPYVPNPPPAAPQPEGAEVDEIMQDPRPERPSRVEVSETLGRRILVHASEAGTVVAEQLVAQREVTVSSPQEQSRVSEEREVRAVQAVVNCSSCAVSNPEAPSITAEAAQVARRVLRLDQISGAVEWEEEELARWRVAVDRVVQGDPEPEAWDPMGETLSQPGEGPRSLCSRDDLQWHGRPGLTGSPVPQLPSSSVPLLEGPVDPSEGQVTAASGEIDVEESPSEQLASTQPTPTPQTPSRGGRAGRRSYIPKELWSPQLRKEHEEFKSAKGERRHEIWLGWSSEERRLVYLASSASSRMEQLRWKGQVKHVLRRTWAKYHSDEEDEQE
jgi:hypothetical protein